MKNKPIKTKVIKAANDVDDLEIKLNQWFDAANNQNHFIVDTKFFITNEFAYCFIMYREVWK